MYIIGAIAFTTLAVIDSPPSTGVAFFIGVVWGACICNQFT